MLENERADDPPDVSDARGEPASSVVLAPWSGVGEPGRPEPVLVEARPTPLPRVDGALLALSVHVLRDARPPQRNFCPPPNPPAGSGPQTFSPSEPDSRFEYDAFQGEDSSISLMERIEGVSRPISSRPPPSWPDAQLEQDKARRRRRILAWLGVAAGVVHCMVLALVLSAPARPKLIVDDVTSDAAPRLSSESLANAFVEPRAGARGFEARGRGREGDAEADEQVARPRAGALESARTASRRRSIDVAPPSRGKRNHVASLRSHKRKRRHSAMRRASSRGFHSHLRARFPAARAATNQQ